MTSRRERQAAKRNFREAPNNAYLSHEEKAERARLNSLRAEIRAEFYGMPALDPHRHARTALQGDPILNDLLDRHIASGGQPIDLAGVPAYRRARTVEDACHAYLATQSADPCGSCGSRAFRFPVYGSTRGPREAAPAHATRTVTVDGTRHDLMLCAACHDAETWYHDGLVGLASQVLAALAGYQGGIGGHRARFAFEQPNHGDGTPWSHIAPGAAVGLAKAELRAGNFQRSRMATSPGQARLLAERVGLPASRVHIWTAKEIPAQDVAYANVAPPQQEFTQAHIAAMTKARATYWRDVLAAEAKHDRLTDEWLAAHPLEPGTGYTADLADEWDALIKARRDDMFKAETAFHQALNAADYPRRNVTRSFGPRPASTTAVVAA